MRTNWRTVVVSCVLSVVITLVIAGWVFRSAPVEAQSRFSSIQFARSEGGWWFFDTRTGDIWVYDEGKKVPLWHFRLTQLGAPLEKMKTSSEKPQTQ